MFKVITKWCRDRLSQLSQGTFYPHIFQKIQAYDKQYPTILPTWIARVAVGLVVLVSLRVTCKPVVIRGCTWILSEQRRQVAVEAQTVHLGTMTRRIQTVGKLTANASVTIRSEIHGRIKKIAFKEGGQVKKDDLLIQFEDDDIQAELKQAEAELALRKADYSRAVQLQQNRAGTMKDYDKAQAELAVSEGRVAAARSKLAKTTITAPFEGTIGIIHFGEGSYIQSNQELVHLVDTTPMKVDFKVPEKFVNDVGPGQMAEVRVQALGDRVFMASVDAVDSKIDTESRFVCPSKPDHWRKR
jgi:membrane fusion protein, multidrug efflux system